MGFTIKYDIIILYINYIFEIKTMATILCFSINSIKIIIIINLVIFFLNVLGGKIC